MDTKMRKFIATSEEILRSIMDIDPDSLFQEIPMFTLLKSITYARDQSDVTA
jgi:hypothetical protein